MSLFVLVHGACHTPWCWEPVAAALEQRGHQVVAPDLPADDPTAGLDDYARVVLDAIDPAVDDVVLVGHSLGGLTIPVVASRRPVSAMVFVAGIIAKPGQSLADLADEDADRDGPLGDGEFTSFDNGTFIFTEAGAMRALYHDCPDELAREAVNHLRPQRSLWAESSPIADWPDTRVASIVCTADRIVNQPWAERVARERVGVEPILFDSGHSPMLSQPDALADVLAAVAST